MLTLIAAAMAALPSEVKADYDVFVGDRMAGNATIVRKASETKGYIAIQRIELSAPDGRKAIVNQENEYSSDGTPIRKVLTQGAKTISVVFIGRTARLKVEDENGSRETTIGAPIEAEIRATSDLWFVSITPNRGAIHEYHRFDLSALKWVKTTARYVGEEQLSTSIGTIAAHLVEIDQNKTWFAADGLPVRMAMDNVRMERKAQ